MCIGLNGGGCGVGAGIELEVVSKIREALSNSIFLASQEHNESKIDGA